MFIPTSKESNIAQKLAMNAQRLRVIPDFHNGIFVNIPAINYSIIVMAI